MRENFSSSSLASMTSSGFLRAGVTDALPPSREGQVQHHRRGWTIALFSFTTLLLFADQNLMSPNLTDIADEFGFDDEERDHKLGGDISLAFFLLGAPASMVVGCLADSSDRSVVFAWTVFIGEGACLATYWVQTYEQLYVCRAITGFSVGGAVPLIYSVLGDLFAAQDRHLISAVVSFGTGAGIAVGQAVAGFLGPAFGWRLPFLVVALPALFTALLVLLTVPDPERGAMEFSTIQGDDDAENDSGVALMPLSSETEQDPNTVLSSSKEIPLQRRFVPRRTNLVLDDDFDGVNYGYYSRICGPEIKMHARTMIQLLSTPTVLLAILQGAPGCVTWGIINVFLNDFLSEDRGFSVQMATTTLMFFSVGNAFGLFLLGGGLAQRLYRADKKYPALLAGTMALSGCFPLWVLFNWVDVSTSYWKVILISFLAGFGSGPTGPIIKATLTNVTHPQARGQAFAFFNLFDDFGKGLGPFFVALLISNMGGRLPAFNIGILGWVICSAANFAIYFVVERDESAMLAELAMARSDRGVSIR